MSDQKLTRQERRQQHKRQKQMQSIGIMVIGLLIIVGGFLLISLTGGPGVEVPDEISYSMVDGNAIGDPNAPVVIEEYFSFLCIHCRNFAEESFNLLVEEYVYTGQVYYVSRAFADPASPAGFAAQAAYCAGDQGQYFQMHDIIFANFNSTGYTQNELESMAEEIGLNMDEYNQCLQSGKYADPVAADLARGTEAGITGTPSFLINDLLAVVGNREYSFFQQQIETALQTANN